MQFREYLNESRQKIKLSNVTDIPKYLKNFTATEMYSKFTFGFYQINELEKPLYLKIFYSDKETGKSLENTDVLKVDKIDRDKLYYKMAYFAKTKTDEKRKKFTNITDEKIFNKFFK